MEINLTLFVFDLKTEQISPYSSSPYSSLRRIYYLKCMLRL